MDAANTQESSPKSSGIPTWLLIGVPIIALGVLVHQMANRLGVETEPVNARQAFASGNMNAAIESYRAYVAKHPKDIGARGELGNVYFTVGASNEAAQAYFETASLALEQNQVQVAEQLLPVIDEINPELAHALEQRLIERQMQAQPRATEGPRSSSAPQRPDFGQPRY